jgi:hypothetical protein
VIFGVPGSGFGVRGSGSGFRVLDSGFTVQGSRFGVRGGPDRQRFTRPVRAGHWLARQVRGRSSLPTVRRPQSWTSAHAGKAA